MSTLVTKIKYKTLYAFSTTPCICSLENPKSKKVLLFASDNPCLYVTNLISRLITKKHGNQELYKDRRKLKLNILETNTTDKWSLLRWQNHYSKNGYTFYTAYKPVSLTLHIKIDYRHGVKVELCNTGGKGFVVGVFKTMPEAESWVDTFYPDLEYIEPVFATNIETIEYNKKSLTNSSNKDKG